MLHFNTTSVTSDVSIKQMSSSGIMFNGATSSLAITVWRSGVHFTLPDFLGRDVVTSAIGVVDRPQVLGWTTEDDGMDWNIVIVSDTPH